MKTPRSWRALVFVSAALLPVASANVAGAEAKSGAAMIVDPKTGDALTSGGSQSTWALKLPRPTEDRCSGDSASDAFFSYSYLVSGSVAPDSLELNPDTGVSPVPGKIAYPLIDNFERPYISRNVAPETGQVNPGSGFTFKRLSVDGKRPGTFGLPVGTYNLGFACWDANARQLDRFWNLEVTFTASTSDPNGLVWRAAASSGATADADTAELSPLAVALPIAGVAVAAGIVARRRSRAAADNTATNDANGANR